MASQTKTNYGEATTPGPLTSIAFATPASAGAIAGDYIKITATVYYSGTPVAPNEDDNLQIVADGGLQQAVIEIPGGSTNVVESVTILHKVVNPSLNVAISNIRAATAGAIYHCYLQMTRLDSSGANI